MVTYCNKLLTDISTWMEDIGTYPHLRSMIVSALSEDTINLPNYNYSWWRPLQVAFRKIPQLLILQGFLLQDIDEAQ